MTHRATCSFCCVMNIRMQVIFLSQLAMHSYTVSLCPSCLLFLSQKLQLCSQVWSLHIGWSHPVVPKPLKVATKSQEFCRIPCGPTLLISNVTTLLYNLVLIKLLFLRWSSFQRAVSVDSLEASWIFSFFGQSQKRPPPCTHCISLPCLWHVSALGAALSPLGSLVV